MKRDGTASFCTKLLFITLTCAASSFAQTASDAAALQKQYTDAVNDARTAKAEEIINTLIPVVRCNSNLRWEDEPDGSVRVLVATWVNGWVAKNYDGKEGQLVPIPSGAYPFVTTVPEVKNFCSNPQRAGTNLTLRLEQLLGLPPMNGKVEFVELWVDPNDLFRPCPDPEIADSRCELDFPQTGFLTVSLSYVKWFDNQVCQSYPSRPKDYTGTDLMGYPWTRLGYTYDWGIASGHVGMSEFVIRPGSQVKVKAVTPTADYCRNIRSTS
jgi:hypothetical protein